MQFLVRKLTDNSFVLPGLVVLICIWRIFVPQLSANAGLGWDGYKYYLMTVDGLQSSILDSYYILRIFPCLLIHVLFKLFHLSFTPEHVILAFKIMATVLLGGSAWLVKKIFEHYHLSGVAQLTGFVLVFLNYAVLNFTYYYPVMTDASTFFLSVALFYFFIKGELLNIMLVGLIGAFTWPIILPMAAALLMFPKVKNDFVPVPAIATIALGILCAVTALALGWYFVLLKGEKADELYTLPISKGMIPVTFLYLGIVYFFIVKVICNRNFFDIKYLYSQINGNRIFGLAALLVTFALIRSSLNVTAPSQYLSFYTQIKASIVYTFQRPLIGIVSHFNYFGAVMLLLIIFWRRIAAFITTFGLGVAGSVFFSLFLYITLAESRRLIHLFPWLMILVSLFIGQYQFNKIFYILLFIINFAAAKLWLFFDYSNAPILPDGTIDFPSQWFFMHLGRWMTEYTWVSLCLALGISLLLLFISMFRIEFGKKEMLFYPQFKLVTYEREFI